MIPGAIEGNEISLRPDSFSPETDTKLTLLLFNDQWNLQFIVLTEWRIAFCPWPIAD